MIFYGKNINSDTIIVWISVIIAIVSEESYSSLHKFILDAAWFAVNYAMDANFWDSKIGTMNLLLNNYTQKYARKSSVQP